MPKIYKSKELQLPKLIDYAVRIPPGSSSCIMEITHNGKEFKTRGLDSDQTVAKSLLHKNAECDPHPNPIRRAVNLTELDHKTKELQSN
jgi:D-citramalate synthase